MSDDHRDGEQSMDDILASIRKIISDDAQPVVVDPGVEPMAPATATGDVLPVQRQDDLADIVEPAKVSAVTAEWPFGGASVQNGELVRSAEPAAEANVVRDEAINEMQALRREPLPQATAPQPALAPAEMSGLAGMPKRQPARQRPVQTDAEPPIAMIPVPAPQVDEGKAPITDDPPVETQIAQAPAAEVSVLDSSAVGSPILTDASAPSGIAEADVPATRQTAEAVVSAVAPTGHESVDAPIELAPVLAASTTVVTEPARQSAAAMLSEVDAAVHRPLSSPAVVNDVALAGSADALIAPLASETKEPAMAPAGDDALKAVVVDALQPVLKEWLDVHLPPLLDKALRAEIEKTVQTELRKTKN